MSPDHLERLLQQAGGFYREGTALVAKCPRCHKQKLHFRLELPNRHLRNPYPFRFECFSGACSKDKFAGRPEYALAEMLGISVLAARKELGGQSSPYRCIDESIDLSIEEDVSPQEPEPLEWPADYLLIADKRAERGAAYLVGRGIPVDIASEYGVRYSVVDRSIIFPVIAKRQLRGWQTRLIIDNHWVDADGKGRESPKAMTSKGFERRWWMFQDRLENSPHAFVLEGPIDSLAAHLCQGNVASMGKKLTPALLETLGAYAWRDLYCGLDRGTEAETERLVGEFDQAIKHSGRRCWLVNWPRLRCSPCLGAACLRCGGKGWREDAGALGMEVVYECWRKARPTSSRTVVFDLSLHT